MHWRKANQWNQKTMISVLSISLILLDLHTWLQAVALCRFVIYICLGSDINDHSLVNVHAHWFIAVIPHIHSFEEFGLVWWIMKFNLIISDCRFSQRPLFMFWWYHRKAWCIQGEFIIQFVTWVTSILENIEVLFGISVQ